MANFIKIFSLFLIISFDLIAETQQPFIAKEYSTIGNISVERLRKITDRCYTKTVTDLAKQLYGSNHFNKPKFRVMHVHEMLNTDSLSTLKPLKKEKDEFFLFPGGNLYGVMHKDLPFHYAGSDSVLGRYVSVELNPNGSLVRFESNNTLFANWYNSVAKTEGAVLFLSSDNSEEKYYAQLAISLQKRAELDALKRGMRKSLKHSGRLFQSFEMPMIYYEKDDKDQVKNISVYVYDNSPLKYYNERVSYNRNEHFNCLVDRIKRHL